MLPADTFSRLATLDCKYRLGQSATPMREDHRENFVFALTGYPLGLAWQDLMKILGKKYHDINVYIVANLQQKINLVTNLLDKESKTIIYVNLIDIGTKIANLLGVPFIHGATKNRIQIAKESKIFVASRVMELGISLKDLENIIEVDFLFGSRREQVQRTGRLFHSAVAKKHDIIMTKEEFEKYGKRLHGLVEKGFRINLKPMVSGVFRIKKEAVKFKKIKKVELNIIDELFDEGFFVIERKFSEVTKEMKKRGVIIISQKKSKIFVKLNNLVESKKLYKVKKSDGYRFVQR